MNDLKLMAISKNMEESVQGIDRLIKISDDISDTLIKAIVDSDDRFVATERVSLLFYNYLNKLKNLINSEDRDLGFWAASLIVHYNINDYDAEKNLLDAIKHDLLSKAYSATTILCKVKSSHVKSAIVERLKNDAALSNEAKVFFKEKLQEI